MIVQIPDCCQSKKGDMKEGNWHSGRHGNLYEQSHETFLLSFTD